MNFSFSTPHKGACLVKLWASGRYGFSLPKKVEITGPDGVTVTFVHRSRKVGIKSELTNRTLVRIAIAQYLAAAGGEPALPEVEIDDGATPAAVRLAPSAVDEEAVEMVRVAQMADRIGHWRRSLRR